MEQLGYSGKTPSRNAEVVLIGARLGPLKSVIGLLCHVTGQNGPRRLQTIKRNQVNLCPPGPSDKIYDQIHLLCMTYFSSIVS